MRKVGILLLLSACLGMGCAVTAKDIKQWGKEKNTKKIEALMVFLNDKNPDISNAAIQALGDIGAPVVNPLITAIKLEHSCVRENKAKALGEISDPQAVNPLVTALKEGDTCIRAVVAISLANIGEASVKPLIEVLRDERLDVRQSAAGVLDKLDWEPKDDLDKAYYVIATESWDEIHKWDKLDAGAVGAFVDALKYGRINRDVESVLTQMGRSAVDPLIAKLRNAQIRRTVAWTLSKIGAPAVRSLIPLLQDGHLRQPVAWILSEIGEPAVKPLVAVLRDVRLRQAVAEALIRIGRPAVKPLISALRDEDPRLRSTAAEALGRIGDRRAIDALAVIAREDNDVRVRRTAVRALEKIRW